MGKKDKRVDQYIAKSVDFTKPILVHLRELVHMGCPDVIETIKWGMPNFEHHGLMCGLARFKEHCAFVFFKAALMKDKSLMANAKSESAMGHLGKITSLKDLPSDSKLLRLIKEAAKINEAGLKVIRKNSIAKKALAAPSDFKTYLSKSVKAKNTFDNLAPSHKRDYIEWITEAKTEKTRSKRIKTSIEWLSEGKPRNWKYMKK
jgi:uncharacterized protein YdeI (YjbR/CyaY-like superfamily)